jgi:hypothetical protein
MGLKAKKSSRGSRAKKAKKSLGRSALTGTRILRPAAAKGGKISLNQVLTALRSLSSSSSN